MFRKIRGELQIQTVRLVSTACLSLAVAGGAAAGKVNIPKEGQVDFSNCFGGDHADYVLKDNIMAGSWRLWGATYTTPPGGSFDVMAIRCFGTYSWLVDKETEHGYCEITDLDGDKFIWTFGGKNFTSSGPVIAGTGKYEGMAGTLSSSPITMYPTTAPGNHHRCHRVTGDYKLK